MLMKYLSVCSGIEAATVAWHPLGWEAVAYSEIEKFPCEVLKHHYPQTPNWGDMTKYKEWPDESNINVLVGGTPCQSFSVAGLRKGLDDPRGNLMLTYLAIANKYRPEWLVWENVPGVLSSNKGRDFASLLRGMGELGYGFAYRVLDAQYFGVPQRRRRVFVIGCLGSWQRAAAVLFERQSLQGDTPPSREKREEIASFTSSSIGGYSKGVGTLRVNGGDIGGGSENIAVWPTETAPTLDAHFGTKMGLENQHINGGAGLFVPAYGIPGNWIGRKPENGGNATEPMQDVAPCQTKTDRHAVAHAFKMRGGCEGGGKGYLGQDECAFTLSTNQDQQIAYGIGESPDVGHCLRAGASKADKHESTTYVQNRMAVRRLTPRECERLQGFPDDYTLIPIGKKERIKLHELKSRKVSMAADGPRYKALGNSMAVPVMRWLGERIDMASQIKKVA